jgi:hypothetical protein
MKRPGWKLLLAVLAVPFIIGGNCAFFFSSGGGSSDEDEPREGLTVVVRSGHFVDAPVQGLYYESGTVSGLTSEDGEFRYVEGQEVRFAIGDIVLGNPVEGKAILTPLDLVEDGSLDSTAVINIARLLQSLDADEDENTITIPGAVQESAVTSNELVASAIRFLAFDDETGFTNAASQLVASLTRDYPRTVTLVGRETAREHLARTLARLKAAE